MATRRRLGPPAWTASALRKQAPHDPARGVLRLLRRHAHRRDSLRHKPRESPNAPQAQAMTALLQDARYRLAAGGSIPSPPACPHRGPTGRPARATGGPPVPPPHAAAHPSRARPLAGAGVPPPPVVPLLRPIPHTGLNPCQNLQPSPNPTADRAKSVWSATTPTTNWRSWDRRRSRMSPCSATLSAMRNAPRRSWPNTPRSAWWTWI